MSFFTIAPTSRLYAHVERVLRRATRTERARRALDVAKRLERRLAEAPKVRRDQDRAREAA